MDKRSTVKEKPRVADKDAAPVRKEPGSRIISDVLRRVKHDAPKAWRDFSAHSQR